MDHVKWLFFSCLSKWAGCRAKDGFRVMLKDFEIEKLFLWWFVSLLYKTKRSHVAVRLLNNRSKNTSKWVRTSVRHSAIVSCAIILLVLHFDLICVLNRLTATWNLFVKWNTK